MDSPEEAGKWPPHQVQVLVSDLPWSQTDLKPHQLGWQKPGPPHIVSGCILQNQRMPGPEKVFIYSYPFFVDEKTEAQREIAQGLNELGAKLKTGTQIPLTAVWFSSVSHSGSMFRVMDNMCPV